MYQKTTLPFDQIPQLSKRDKAYQRGDSSLRPFFEHLPELEAFESAIKLKKGQHIDRNILVEILEEQYKELQVSDAVHTNIKSLLSPYTFTITTAHQPSLLTGPLYYIYKICSAISLTRRLAVEYPDYKFVPIFIIGGEDHDFEEIATVHLFNRDFTWQSNQNGATGRMSLEGLAPLVDDIIGTFGNSPHAQELEQIIRTSYQSATNYAAFMKGITRRLFEKYGLVILNMDHPRLKEKLLPFIIEDLQEKISHRTVNKDQEGLKEAGFDSQAHAREINIFWHGKDRTRVTYEGSNYIIGDQIFSQEAFTKKVQNEPENISPNVILRPVYQEIILPNLAYIGGGGELAYWMERKSLFGHWRIPFPILIRRDSVLIIDKKSQRTLDDSSISLPKIFDREEIILGTFAKEQAAVEINLTEYKKAVAKIFENIAKQASRIDPTLKKTVGAESAKAEKSMDHIEQKMLRAAKQKNEVALKRISKIKHKLFPGNNSLQERYDNFIPFFLQHGHEWIEALIRNLDPLNKSFKILIES